MQIIHPSEVEQIPEGEAEAIQKIIDIELRLLQRRVAQDHLGSPDRPVPRAQHPKHHGCVRADFVIADDIPIDFRYGVFREPGKVFPSWIRFSNARKLDDRETGGHGMAIKLMQVAGDRGRAGEQHDQSQDFLLLDNPVFFIRNAVEFAEFDQALLKSKVSQWGKLSVLWYFLRHPREFWILRQIEKNQCSDPLGTKYWSVTPYKLGKGAVKYMTMPRADGPPVATIQSGDQLRTAMKTHLQTRDAYFDFCVQPRVDATEQPIEDATRLWRSSPQKVATIHIPCQSFDSPEQMEFCENISFSPWQALDDHRPLGSLNRMRKATYVALSDFRHRENRVPNIEPTPETLQSGKRAS